jgi:spore coat protein U-like protein
MHRGLRFRPALAAGLMLGLLAPPAFAQDPTPHGTRLRTATFTVSVIVESDCRIAGIEDLQFGRVGADAGGGLAETRGATRLSVTCSRNLRYTMFLDRGDVPGSTVAARLMAGAGSGERLNYQLYLDPACTTVWGDGSSGGSSGVSGTGTGTPQDYAIYGRLLSQALPEADRYSAVITASLTF